MRRRTPTAAVVAGRVRTLLAGCALAGVVLFGGQPAGAQEPPVGDPIAGRKVVHICSVCHGSDGIAKVPEAANLAGQNASYIIRQLMAFRDGSRKNETMSLLAAGLSNAQIADVAAYYGGIQIQVMKIPGQ